MISPDNVFLSYEADNLSHCVTGCARLAKQINDPYSYIFFLTLMEQGRGEVTRSAMSNFPDMNKDYLRQCFDRSSMRAYKLFSMTAEESATLSTSKDSILFFGAGLLDEEISDANKLLELFTADNGANDNYHTISLIITRKRILKRSRARVINACYSYAISLEAQKQSNEALQSPLTEIFDETVSYLRSISDQAAATLLEVVNSYARKSTDDLSACMLHVRRCIKQIADTLQPASDSDGLTDDKYLNRIEYYLEQNVTESKLLKIEVSFLGTLLRKIQKRSSKGVHSAITEEEVRNIILQFIFFLHTMRQSSILKT